MNFIIAILSLFSVCYPQVDECDFSSSNILDTVFPQVDDGIGLWVSADVLFLTPKENAIVLTNHKTNLFKVNDVTIEPTLDTKFNWSFGSRIGFGCVDSFQNWDMALYWTYFPSSVIKKSNTRKNPSEGMFPIWSLSSDIIPYDWVVQAKMHWMLNVNLLDLDLGRDYSFKWFHFRSFAGIRSAWIDQALNVNYSGGIFVNGPDLYATFNHSEFDRIRMKNNYWGMGPLLGVMPQFDLGRGWRLYANASGSYMLGYFYLVQHEIYLMNTRFRKRTNRFAARAALDASGGITWAAFIASGRYALTFQLGWEYHLFFNQFALQKDSFGLVPGSDDLSLTGAVFSGRFDF